MEDKRIIELFFGRDEAAIAESGKKYGKYLRYIAFSVLGDESDCEEVENDTYLRAWNSIPPERPVSLKGYLASLCRNAFPIRQATILRNPLLCARRSKPFFARLRSATA